MARHKRCLVTKKHTNFILHELKTGTCFGRTTYKYQTNEICLCAVKMSGNNLENVENQTDKICLAAVHENVFALRFVSNQTEEICLTAIKNYAYALRWIRYENQTTKVCLAAVRENGLALQYIKYQTPEICKNALYMFTAREYAKYGLELPTIYYKWFRQGNVIINLSEHLIINNKKRHQINLLDIKIKFS